jgi:hypothetical protein
MILFVAHFKPKSKCLPLPKRTGELQEIPQAQPITDFNKRKLIGISQHQQTDQIQS